MMQSLDKKSSLGVFMKVLLGYFFALSLSVGCATNKNSFSQDKAPKSENAKEVRPTLVSEKKKSVKKASAPLKGKFLDYIFQIQPDHKQPGYSISTDTLNNGYAYGSGPYDGWFVEFFLFRGNGSDFVIRQTTGPEVENAEQTYGAKIEIYQFVQNKMSAKKLDSVWPVKQIDELFLKATEKLKTQAGYENWAFHKLVRLPIQGTTSLLKLCQKSPEPPFATETSCVTIGELVWNKKSFKAKASPQATPSNESI